MFYLAEDVDWKNDWFENLVNDKTNASKVFGTKKMHEDLRVVCGEMDGY